MSCRPNSPPSTAIATRPSAGLATVRSETEEKLQRLGSELRRVTAELTQAERCLPADFKIDYDRISRARGEDALAQVEGETCGGCYQMLTAQTINDLLLSEARVLQELRSAAVLAGGSRAEPPSTCQALFAPDTSDIS